MQHSPENGLLPLTQRETLLAVKCTEIFSLDHIHMALGHFGEQVNDVLKHHGLRVVPRNETATPVVGTKSLGKPPGHTLTPRFVIICKANAGVARVVSLPARNAGMQSALCTKTSTPTMRFFAGGRRVYSDLAWVSGKAGLT